MSHLGIEVNQNTRQTWVQDFGAQQVLSTMTGFYETMDRIRTHKILGLPHPVIEYASDLQIFTLPGLQQALDYAATYTGKVQHGLGNVETKSGQEWRAKHYKPTTGMTVGMSLYRYADGELGPNVHEYPIKTQSDRWAIRIPGLVRPAVRIGLCAAQSDRSADLEHPGPPFVPVFSPIASAARATVLCTAEVIADHFKLKPRALGSAHADELMKRPENVGKLAQEKITSARSS